MPLNLAEVPTQYLVEALANRNDAIVFLQTRGDDYSCVFDGNGLLCAGLLQYALHELELASVQADQG